MSRLDLTLSKPVFFAPREQMDAFLFDISPCKEKYTDQQSMLLLKEQHPNVHACVPLSDGPRQYLEVYIMPQKDSNDIAQKGLTFPDVNLVVYLRATLGETAKVVNLKLTYLPMLPAEEVKNGLAKSLTVFGDIMDVGISTDTATGFFMGAGYAVLNIQQDPSVLDEQKFPTLSHQISWCESPDHFFHATWSNMPTWCRYCHKEGHTKIECPQSRARIICYSCHQNGHRSFECPRRNMSFGAHKRRDRKSYQTPIPAPALSLDQTTAPPDTDDDPDDLDYQEDGGEDMSITSEGTSDDRIEYDELNQLQKDLGKPAIQTHITDHVLEFNNLANTSSSTTNKDLTTILCVVSEQLLHEDL